MKQITKKWISSLLACALILGNLPVPALAQESDGLCDHHTQHTTECGYSPAVEGHECGHEHTEECYRSATECVHTHGDCGYVPAVAERPCACEADKNGEIVHEEGCGYQEAVAEVPCGHVCSEESGCVTQILDCQHIHDDNCGYVEAKEEVSCTFQCEECTKESAGQSPTEQEISVMPIAAQAAFTTGINDQSVFIKQASSNTCTLASSVMMLRRRAILENNANWSEITESAVKPVAWGSGLLYTFKYSGMTVDTLGLASSGYTTVTQKKQFFIDCMNSNPEGIVIYNHSKPHAVLLTDYDANNDCFYCADPSSRAGKGRIPLTSCTIPGNTQDEIIGNINQIWRITSSDGTGGGSSGHTHSFFVESEALHPHKEYKKCNSCGYWEYTGNTIDVSSCEQCHPVLFYLDLNGYLDNSTSPDLADFGACDIYINGELVADDCTDFFNQQIPAGSTYEIRDIRATDGHNYAGVYSGQLSGTMNGNTEVILKFFSNPKATLSQNATEIIVKKYGAYLTYSYTGDTAHGYGYTIESSNPAVATVEFIGDNAIAVYGVSVGTCKVIFQLIETDTNTILDTAECTVEVSREGTFGDGLKYNVTPGGHMTISGNGSIPDYNEELSPWAGWCSEIKTLTLSNGITGIGWSAFLSCDSLTEVTIADTVTDIEPSAFARCTALQNVEIPGSVNTLQDGAFAGCESLKTVTLSEGVNRLQNGVFLSCSSLSDISIPQSMSSIGSSSFYNCVSLTDVYYAGSITQWGAIRIEDSNDALINANILCADPTIGGTCGDNLTWTLENGVLTISGTGDMANYTDVSPDGTQGTPAPWYGVRHEISRIVIEEGVTSIGTWAFYNCTNATSVSIPSSVTAIQQAAFFGCSSLPSVTIPNSISEIGNMNFAYCTRLSSVSLPNELQYIGNNAFMGCSGLESVTIPNNVTSIGLGAFQSCTSLTSVILPDSLGSVSSFAFFDCTKLKAVTIPDSVTVIGSYAFGFYRDADIYSTDIYPVVPDFQITAARASSGYFYAKENGTPCVIVGIFAPTYFDIGVARADLNVYKEDNTTSSVLGTVKEGTTVSPYLMTVMSDSTKWGLIMGMEDTDGKIIWGRFTAQQLADETKEPVRGWVCLDEVDEIESGTCGDNLTWKLVDGTLTISGSGNMEDYNTYPPDAAPWCDLREQITSVVVCDGVVGIGEYAFFDCSNLTTVTLAGSVTSVGEGAFSYCKSLTSITIPDSVSFIGENAFCDCRSLTSVDIPDSVTSIKNGTFQVCESLTSITIPDSVTSIGAYAFSGCMSLASVDIPDSVTSIKNGTFENCESLTSITIPDSVTSIGDWAFKDCTGLMGKLTMPSSLKTIGEHAFESCTDLTGIALNEGLTSIGFEAFMCCSGLTGELVIPSSVETIRENAFSCCSGLTSVTLNEGLTKISDGVFSNCRGLTGELVIPNSVERIGNSSFAWCSSLNSVVIPARVTEIGICAFVECNALEKITFGQSWAHSLTIGENAFALDREKSLDTRIFAPDAQDIHTAITDYDWIGSNRNVTYGGMNLLELDNTGLENQSVVWVDGEAYPIQHDSTGAAYVNIPDDAPPVLVTYSYNNSSTDRHSQYPTGMQVSRISETDSGYTVERIPALDNLLQYSGSSIRITGKKGIRMITSVDKTLRSALINGSLEGFQLMEYGTLLAQTSKLGNDPLVLGGENVKSNYAYKKGVADPVFQYAGNLIQYTNVLVGFNMEQCKEDIAMRPYMKLMDENGEEFVIYGGIVYRSIGYIAWQNRDVFSPGTAAYNYVWDIIHAVYGDDYKG